MAKKKKKKLDIKIEGGVSSETARALLARQRRESQEAKEFKDLPAKHRAGELLPASEELKKRGKITRKETHPEEFVVRGGRQLSAEQAMAEESFQAETEALQPQTEGDEASEFLRKVPIAGKTIEGARNVLGTAFSATSKLFGSPEFTAEIEEAFGLEPGQSFLKDQDIQSFGITLATVGIGSFLLKGVSAKLAGRGVIKQGLNVDAFGKTIGLTKAQTAKVATELGRQRVKQATAKLIQMNTPAIQKVLSSGWTKLGVGALSGVALTTGWLASDNILTGSAFSARLVQESVDEGIISKAEGINLMNEIQEWNDGAESFVRGRDKIDPLTWGALGKPFLINAEKSQTDLELRKQLLLAS